MPIIINSPRQGNHNHVDERSLRTPYSWHTSINYDTVGFPLLESIITFVGRSGTNHFIALASISFLPFNPAALSKIIIK